VIRSLVFNVILFIALVFYLIAGVVVYFASSEIPYKYWFGFYRLFDFITKNVGGITFKIENPQNILDGRVIYAVRHESMWETLVLIGILKNPVFIMKQELKNLPFFGVLAEKSNSIFVDRNQGMKALINASKSVSDVLDKGYQIVIFPEGTRIKSGEYVPLKRGISLFYKKNNCKVVPVIHNSGALWSKRSFQKKSGVITLKFMDPIEPGLLQDEFMNKLDDVFRTELKKLVPQEK